MASYGVDEWFVFVAYIVLGVIGFVGNGFILLVIWKQKSMRTTTFHLLFNQALSDMWCGLLYLSLWFFCSSKMIDSSGGFGNFVCEFMYTIKVSTFFVSVFSMMAISIERFIKLHYLQSAGLSPKWTIGGSWLAGLLLAVLCMFHFRGANFFTNDRLVGCHVVYALPNAPFFQGHYNLILVLLIGAVIPLAITGFTYYKVIQKIRGRRLFGVGGNNNGSSNFSSVVVGEAEAGAAAEGESNGTNGTQVVPPPSPPPPPPPAPAQQPLPTPNPNSSIAAAREVHTQQLQKNKQKTVEMLIAILVSYCLLCFPLYTILVVNYFIVGILPADCNSRTREPLWYILAYFACVFSICINPIIYCHYKKEFRNEAKSIVNAVIRRELFKKEPTKTVALSTLEESSRVGQSQI